VIEVLLRHYRTVRQTIHLQTGLLISTCVTDVNVRMTYGEFEVLTNVRIQTHYVEILDILLLLPYLIVEPHRFASTTKQSMSDDQGHTLDSRMR